MLLLERDAGPPNDSLIPHSTGGKAMRPLAQQVNDAPSLLGRLHFM